MIKFTKPTNLNGAELVQQLQNAGVKINQPPFVDGNNDLWLDIADKDQSKAATIVNDHNGTTTPTELTVAEKLASVGLSIDDLKTALGV